MASTVKALEFIEPIVPELIKSWEKFKNQFEDGAVLHLPLGINLERNELYISYYIDSIHIAGIHYDNSTYYLSLERRFETGFTNEIDTHLDGFMLISSDTSIGIRFDNEGGAPISGGLDFENDLCYINGNEHDGIEETLFQLSTTHNTRPIDEIIHEAKVALRVSQLLTKGWTMTCNDTRALENYESDQFIRDALL